MDPSPAELLNPIFNALDAMIQNYGVHLYPVFVWLSYRQLVDARAKARERE